MSFSKKRVILSTAHEFLRFTEVWGKEVMNVWGKALSISAVLFFSLGCASQAIQSDESKSSSSSAIPRPDFSSLDEKPKVSKKSEKDPYALVTCVNGMETRTMGISGHGDEGEGCELRYEKNEKVMSVPAYSSFGMGHCLKARDRMRGNLEKAGWKCVQL